MARKHSPMLHVAPPAPALPPALLLPPVPPLLLAPPLLIPAFVRVPACPEPAVLELPALLPPLAVPEPPAPPSEPSTKPSSLQAANRVGLATRNSANKLTDARFDAFARAAVDRRGCILSQCRGAGKWTTLARRDSEDGPARAKSQRQACAGPNEPGSHHGFPLVSMGDVVVSVHQRSVGAQGCGNAEACE